MLALFLLTKSAGCGARFGGQAKHASSIRSILGRSSGTVLAPKGEHNHTLTGFCRNQMTLKRSP